MRLLNQPTVTVYKATGDGRTDLLLWNNTSKPVEMALTARTDTSSQMDVKFIGPESRIPVAINEFTLQPKHYVTVTMVVRGDWSGSDSEIELFNHYGTESVGKIPVRHHPATITLEDDHQVLSLWDARTTWIVVKNQDGDTYPVHWKLVNGETICEGDADFLPRSSPVLQCTPSFGWSPFSPRALVSAIKPDGIRGGYRLLILPRPLPTQLVVQPLASFGLQGRLDYYGSRKRAAIKYLVTFVLLAIGGLTSLLLSYYIPNKLLRLDLKEKLLNLAVRTSDLSSRISSRMAVLVRLERSRLTNLLKTRNPFSPDFAAIATLCEVGIERLNDKVDILEQMDTVLGQVEKYQTIGAPPSKLDGIFQALDDVGVLLSKPQTSDDEIREARDAVKSASDQVNTLGQRDDGFGQQLATDCQAVGQDLNSLTGSPAWASFSPLAARPIAVVRAVAAALIEPENYIDLDYSLQKARIIRSYVRLRDGITSADVTERLNARTDKLVDLLQRQSWDGLRSARLLIREMEDDIYPDRIAEAVQSSAEGDQAQQVSIRVDPAWVYERASVEFRLRFFSQELDTCAARDEFFVAWNYDDGHEGEGWIASHYFLPRAERVRTLMGRFWRFLSRRPSHIPSHNPEWFHVTATIFDPDGRPISKRNSPSVTAELTKDIELHPSEFLRSQERWRAEAIKLSAALGIAVTGLISGAQTQIDKLDLVPGLVAVFIVGFTADSVKRLLTSPSA
ncbi:MAG TPA: hypothetical protein VK578_05005 [Edaphobacter sp.]|nr:hypothetical protein [Edaphobacter sp.]